MCILKRVLVSIPIVILLSALNIVTVSAISINADGLSTDELTLTGTTSVTVSGDTSFDGVINTTDTTQATNSSTGSIITSGGLGVAKDAHIAGDIYQGGNLLLPPGSIILYGGTSAPDGYLVCNGSAVSRTTYADLFAAIGTTFGVGDGGNTFNLPNFSGRMPVGAGVSDVGVTGGSSTVTLTVGNMPAHDHGGSTSEDGAHSHTVTDPGHTHTVQNTIQYTNNNTPDGLDSTPTEIDTVNSTTTTSSSTTTGISINSGGAHSHTISSQGNGEAFSVMNPYLVVNFVIKY